MIYLLALKFISTFSILNVFKYITFRSILSLFISFSVTLLFGGRIIKYMLNIQNGGQPIRLDGPKSHIANKKNTPTMGGVMIISSTLLSVLLLSDITNQYILVMIYVMISFGILGFWDDYLKVKYKNSRGVTGKVKLFWQFLFGFIAVIWISSLHENKDLSYSIAIPFMKDLLINFGWFYLPFAMIIIVGASNATNLTDGLDGLAIGPIMIAVACYGIIAYLSGNYVFTKYLQLYYIVNIGELAIFAAAVIGSGLGFLWYNALPAKIIMGDVGSLSFGAIIGAMSIITKHEILLIIIGGLFVIEAVSVILQVGSYKLYKKRIFLMAPIHHHFEKLGWSETTIVVRFWIVAILFALISLSTFKLR